MAKQLPMSVYYIKEVIDMTIIEIGCVLLAVCVIVKILKDHIRIE